MKLETNLGPPSWSSTFLNMTVENTAPFPAINETLSSEQSRCNFKVIAIALRKCATVAFAYVLMCITIVIKLWQILRNHISISSCLPRPQSLSRAERKTEKTKRHGLCPSCGPAKGLRRRQSSCPNWQYIWHKKW